MTSDNRSSRNLPVERRYIPEAYVDEICPPGRVTPDAWIGAPAGDVWLLATTEDFDFGVTLTPGQSLPFAWVEDLGEVLVTIRLDATYATQGIVPAGVTHFWSGGDSDTLADSLDDFVEAWREMNIPLEEDEAISVRMSRWSDSEVPFRFEIAESGHRFVPVEPEASL